MADTPTITQGLAEIKTIGKRLTSKKTFIETYIARHEIVHDPLTAQGGSIEVIRAERQSMLDLEKRLVDIRMAITKANNETEVVVDGQAHSIAEWLTWRRDIAPGKAAYLKSMQAKIHTVRKEAQAKGMNVTAQIGAQPDSKNIVVNIDERALAQEIEAMEVTLGTLDGLLSHANATTLITIR